MTGSHLWGTMISVPNFIAIHPLIVKISQSEPKWWTDRQTAMLFAWLRVFSHLVSNTCFQTGNVSPPKDRFGWAYVKQLHSNVGQNKWTEFARKGDLASNRTLERSVGVKANTKTNHRIFWQQICNFSTISKAKPLINPSAHHEICSGSDLVICESCTYIYVTGMHVSACFC